MNTENAINEWRKIEGLLVEGAEVAERRFSSNTIATERKILGFLGPQNITQLQEIVRIANDYKVPLYPFSGGHNWGYGSGLPAISNCVVLDLSRMNRIIEFNDKLGYVVVEPGVTQEQLYKYISEKGYEYMVPTTGAGPKGSLLGNALEKGYGITPHEDHFGAVLNMKAILPSGEIYESALSKFGGYRSDSIFRWKVGPYVEGLFAQGNLGIVIQATIALARKPDLVTQFLAFVDNDHFEEAVSAISNIKQQCGSLLGGVNIMNKRRILAMIEAQGEWNSDHTISEMHIRELAQKRNISDWVIMGGIYGPKELQSGALKCVKKELKPIARHVVFLNKQKLKILQTLLKVLPFAKLRDTVKSVERGLNILEGVPSTVALALAYLRNKSVTSTKENLAPDKDNCGLIWFSPLLPIDPSLVRDYTQEITRVCLAKNIEPLITLTAISERCFDSTIPILFDRLNEIDVKNAHDCHRQLIALSREMGIFPYRLDIETMRREYDNVDGACFTLIETIKKAVDPNNIISPGRYTKGNM